MGFSVESLKKVWDLKTLGYLFSFLKIRRNHQHHLYQASVTSYWAALCLREPESTQSVNLASGMAWDPFVPSVPPLFRALVTPHVTVTATSCSLVSWPLCPLFKSGQLEESTNHTSAFLNDSVFSANRITTQTQSFIVWCHMTPPPSSPSGNCFSPHPQYTSAMGNPDFFLECFGSQNALIHILCLGNSFWPSQSSHFLWNLSWLTQAESGSPPWPLGVLWARLCCVSLCWVHLCGSCVCP